ncbi:MAG: DNA polymerase/3'-5' exonuclease PolX [Solirubrobacteraceae bacterium]|nr:MAG: DNA polymerase/3'-5' exonuclease PolX [Solirubrobacterales bacterium]
MPAPSNAQIADALDELGALYELDQASVHRVLAYRTGARAVRESSVSIAALTRAGRVTELPGIGKTLEEKITALLETGAIPAAERLRAQYPPGLLDVMHLPGFGPKKARRLHEELAIDSLESLGMAARDGRIRELRGFGAKAEEQILELLSRPDGGRPTPRMLLPRALDIAAEILEALRAHPAAERVELAGSARRLADTVKDLDIIATASDPRALAGVLTGLELIERHSNPGDAGVRAVTHSGLSVDLKVVAPDQFGNLLQHFTGSKAHNVALREAAVRRGLHVSEYGILDDADGSTLRCSREQEVYARLGLAWIPPELREGRGELELAASDELPLLIEQSDLRGDLHCHTIASDGRNTIEEMASAAMQRGYEYLAITDHSATHGFGDHVSPEDLARQIERVHAVDSKLDGITLLAGSEVNILPDGSLDYSDELLAQLDWAVGSIHTAFSLDERAMTERMLAAIEHPLIDAIGHPTGRKLRLRDGYRIDFERVFEAAARTGTALEINAAPDRRDLSDLHARAAAAAGARIVIDSDAHGTDRLGLIRWGIATARRAWLSAEQVLNTRPWSELAGMRKRARR